MDQERVEVPKFDPSTHILMPVAFAERLLACYFGGGPNHWETRKIPPPSKAPRTATPLERALESAEVEEDDPELPVIDPEYLDALRGGFPIGGNTVVPIGEAATILQRQTATSGSPNRVNNGV